MDKLISNGIKVDMILCDLPYGITSRNKWDCIIPFDQLWARYEDLIKNNGAIVLTASQPFSSALVMSNPKLFRYEWVWQKNNATGHLNAKKIPMKNHEQILVFYKNQTTYNPQGVVPYNKVTRRGATGTNYNDAGLENFQEVTNYPRTIQRFSYDKDKCHPTQKPVALCEYMIKTYTNEKELVLDNCMGSGTTGIACKNLNRDFIGIELDEKYFDIAKDRIKNCI